MNLFDSFAISSDCYLCGCSVDSIIAHHYKHPKSQSPIICQFCHQFLPLSIDTCVTCGLPLSSAISSEKAHSNNSINAKSTNAPCGKCLTQCPPYDTTISAFHYEAPINDFITQLKYSAQFQLLPLLCEYLTKKIANSQPPSTYPDVIIPVPLHPNKLAKRGFNQSRLIANKIGENLDVKVLADGVRRIKDTAAQSGLDSVERKSNIKNAFCIDKPLPSHIAIVDDVITTGLTVSELSKQARKQGAKRIDVWCLARAYVL